MGKAKIFIAIILILLLVAAVGVLAIYHLYPVKYKDLVEKHAEKSDADNAQDRDLDRQEA